MSHIHLSRLPGLAVVVAALLVVCAAGIGQVPASAGARAARGAVAPTAVQPGLTRNWAGYTVGTSSSAGFSAVSARWIAPKFDCRKVQPLGGKASFWVGLGGTRNDNLEQAGTTVMCLGTERARYTAWYGTYPVGPFDFDAKLDVGPGDSIAATVRVQGTRVSYLLENLTAGTHVAKTLPLQRPGTNSAEWIVENPPWCERGASTACSETVRFGRVTFVQATAESANHAGPISDPAWGSLPLVDVGPAGYEDPAAVGDAGPGDAPLIVAHPGPLIRNGSAFTVTS